MNKHIVCFDVETTGLSPVDDYIIQLAMVKFDKDTFETIDTRMWYINPVHKYEMKKGAVDAHGLTKEFIDKNGVSLKTIGQEIIDFVSDSDYLTYNGNTFDVKFIYKDLAIFGFDFPIEGKVFYDAFSLYKLYHPSTLSAVYKNYTGKDLDEAHDALADVNATIEVFKGILNEQSKTLHEVKELRECQMISPEGSIRRVADNNSNEDYIVFSQGKYKDTEFCEVMKKDPSYIKWFGEKVATSYTKRVLNKYFQKKTVKK